MPTLKYYDTVAGAWKYLAAGSTETSENGLPAGGLTGQILVKNGNGDYETAWLDSSTLADKNYVHNFSVESEVTVNHNLGKYPAVQVMDSAGDEVEGEVYYVNTIQLIVRFTNPFSGMVTCN
jgi:hypothetical protein